MEVSVLTVENDVPFHIPAIMVPIPPDIILVAATRMLLLPVLGSEAAKIAPQKLPVENVPLVHVLPLYVQ
jgi:hypothetical protein